MNKAKQFLQSEYGSREPDEGWKRILVYKPTRGQWWKQVRQESQQEGMFVPNRHHEKKVISEFVLLLKLTDNCVGRKYSPKDDVWDIVRGDKITPM